MFLAFLILSILAISANFTKIDSYKPIAGEFLISATVVKNLWGYGISQFLNPWIVKSGYVVPIMVNTALTLFFYLFRYTAILLRKTGALLVCK